MTQLVNSIQGTSMPVLDIQDLNVDFRTRDGIVNAVRGVSMQIEAGKTLGVVGESGSGKSVTAYAALGILPKTGRITDGTVHFGNLELTALQERDLRSIRGRDISMIFQNPMSALNPIRKVGTQIEDVLMEHLKIDRKEARDRAVEKLDLVRIAHPEERYHAYPFELSGGMCQRVMIAIAMACEPTLLVCDEPTTGLDVTTQKHVMDMIAKLCADTGMAAMLITHDLGMAAEYCHDIVVMQQGQLVETGQIGQLFTKPTEEYTQRLVRATPRPDGTLRDLLFEGDEEVVRLGLLNPFAVNDNKETKPVVPNVLEAHRLVKEFPLSSGASKIFQRKKQTKVLRAVDELSFKIEHGKSVGLVGESGCGKTTACRMIARLADPTSGSIRFLGDEIGNMKTADFSHSPFRRDIQFVFQDPLGSLNPRFNAFDSIADPLRRLGEGLSKGEVSDQVEAVCDRAGFPKELLSRFPHQLSGGQQARVGIARAIALEPKLLILDEPTTALDVSVQAIVLNQLARIREEMGLSFLFISHDLNVVRLLCDEVIVMRSGRVVEQNSADEIFSNPKDPYTMELIDAIPQLDQILKTAS